MYASTSPKGIHWTELSQPTSRELASIIRELKLTEADARLCLEKETRPGWYLNNRYLILSMTVPIFFKKMRVTAGGSILFVVMENQLVTIHHEEIPLLKHLYESISKNPDKFLDQQNTQPIDLFIKLIELLNQGTYRKIERVAKYINIVEAAVFQGNERKMVEEISFLTRDVMDIRKIVRPHRNLFTSLPSHTLFRAELYDNWLSLKHGMSDIDGALDMLYESIQQLSQTNTTLLQHKVNELLRLLALYSSIAIPALILISPFNPRSPTATLTDVVVYWGILSILILLLLFIFFRFRGKRVL